MVDPKLPIELTGMEVFYLEDLLSNDDKSLGLPDEQAYKPQGRQLLLLIGGVFNELVQEGNPPAISPDPITVHLTEEQTWLLRQKVRSSAVGYDQTTNVGIGLLRKLYAMLLRFNNDLENWPVAETPYDDFTAEEFKSKLKEFIGDANGSADQSAY